MAIGRQWRQRAGSVVARTGPSYPCQIGPHAVGQPQDAFCGHARRPVGGPSSRRTGTAGARCGGVMFLNDRAGMALRSIQT